MENSISILRRCKGSYERNPSALRLSRNLRQIAFQNLAPSASTSYNISDCETVLNEATVSALPQDEYYEFEVGEDAQCEEIDDFVKYICDDKNNANDHETTDEESYQEVYLVLDDDDESIEKGTEDIDDTTEVEKKSSLNTHATVYFAGYVANKLIKNYNCAQCTKYLLRQTENEKIDDYLIKLRAFKSSQTNSVYGNLRVPSQEFVKFIENFQKEFDEKFKTMRHEMKLSEKMEDVIGKSQKYYFCPQHQHQIINFTAKVIIRLYIRKVNRVLSLKSKKKKDRLQVLEGQ